MSESLLWYLGLEGPKGFFDMAFEALPPSHIPSPAFVDAAVSTDAERDSSLINH